MFRFYGTSIVHKLDPRAKIIWALAIMIVSLIVIDPLYLIPPLAYTIILLLLSGIHTTKEFRSKWILSAVFGVSLLLIVFNGLFAAIEIKGGTVIFYFNIFGLKYPITVEGFYLGTGAALRVMTILLSFLVVAFTTYPRDLANSLEKWKLPYKLTFTLALTFRFIPFLMEEAKRIMEALRSRGYKGFDEGNFIERFRAYTTLFTVLIINSLNLVRKVGMVLEAKCFGVAPRRSSLRDYNFSKIDYLIIGSSVAFIILYLYLRYVLNLGWLPYAHGYVF